MDYMYNYLSKNAKTLDDIGTLRLNKGILSNTQKEE